VAGMAEEMAAVAMGTEAEEMPEDETGTAADEVQVAMGKEAAARRLAAAAVVTAESLAVTRFAAERVAAASVGGADGAGGGKEEPRTGFLFRANRQRMREAQAQRLCGPGWVAHGTRTLGLGASFFAREFQFSLRFYRPHGLGDIFNLAGRILRSVNEVPPPATAEDGLRGAISRI
jgi:hypothetical protein